MPLELRELPTVSRVIVTDNGSTDCSRQVAEDFGARGVYDPHAEYGKACLAGLSEISRQVDAGETAPEIVVFIDGDYSDFAEYLTQLVVPILNKSQDFVLGSRLMGEREPGAMPPQSIYGNMLACGRMRLFWGTRYGSGSVSSDLVARAGIAADGGPEFWMDRRDADYGSHCEVTHSGIAGALSKTRWRQQDQWHYRRDVSSRVQNSLDDRQVRMADARLVPACSGRTARAFPLQGSDSTPNR